MFSDKKTTTGQIQCISKTTTLSVYTEQFLQNVLRINTSKQEFKG